jgi:hypothetical protein
MRNEGGEEKAKEKAEDFLPLMAQPQRSGDGPWANDTDIGLKMAAKRVA